MLSKTTQVGIWRIPAYNPEYTPGYKIDHYASMSSDWIPSKIFLRSS